MFQLPAHGEPIGVNIVVILIYCLFGWYLSHVSIANNSVTTASDAVGAQCGEVGIE
jgi:hypothetical protein